MTEFENEPLDFCRVKKIDEKGFGFLKSINYSGDIFFHFSQIKKEEFLEKLNAMKRGEFFVYFVSKLLPDGRRKVAGIWYELKSVPKVFLDEFIEKFVKQFDEGTTNLYDLIYVYNEAKKMDIITNEHLLRILKGSRLFKTPTVILPFLNKEEIKQFAEVLNIGELKKINEKPYWLQDFIKSMEN